MTTPVDTVNEYQTDLSIEPDLYTATKTGTGIDFRDCEAAVTVDAAYGYVGVGTSLVVSLEESDDDSTYTAIASSSMTTVSTASLNNRSFERKQFFNRTKRYVRAIGTEGGASGDIYYSVVLSARKVSY